MRLVSSNSHYKNDIKSSWRKHVFMIDVGRIVTWSHFKKIKIDARLDASSSKHE